MRDIQASYSAIVVPAMQDFYIDNMHRFIELAHDYNADVILTHQPLLFATTKPLVGQEQMENTHPRLNFFALDDDAVDALSEVPTYRLEQAAYWSMKSFLASYAAQAEALKVLSESEGAGYVDVQALVDGAGPVAIFTSPYHFTFRGAWLIAEGLVPAVEKALSLPLCQ